MYQYANKTVTNFMTLPYNGSIISSIHIPDYMIHIQPITAVITNNKHTTTINAPITTL